VNNKKLIVLASIGTMLEAYDFFIFIGLYKYLNQIFFLTNDNCSFIKDFILLAIVYIMRPIGGIVLGSIGDRDGRKQPFVFSAQAMALSTFIIAFLPSYYLIGIFSPILLMICRIVQGLSFGAELPGAITYIFESFRREKMDYSAGFISFSIGLGAILSSVVCWIVDKAPHDEVINFYWRVPFLIGGILSIALTFFRLKIPETLLFLESKSKKINPIKFVLCKNTGLILKGLIIALLPTLLVIFSHTFPVYLNKFQKLDQSEAGFLMIFGASLFSIFTLIFTFLSKILEDEKVILKIMMLNNLIVLIFALIFLANPDIHYIKTFIFMLNLILALFFSFFPRTISRLFPTTVRYSGVAFCYNVAFAISASFFFISKHISEKYNNDIYIRGLILIISMISLLCFINYHFRREP
jgi:MFS family permease